MSSCDPLRCPGKIRCPALALSRTFGDLIPPAVLEKPKDCLGSVFTQPTRLTVSAGVEWLRLTTL